MASGGLNIGALGPLLVDPFGKCDHVGERSVMEVGFESYRLSPSPVTVSTLPPPWCPGHGALSQHKSN